MTVDERKRLLAHVFEEIRADAEGVTPLRPSEEWKPYMRAVVPLEGSSERKTGLDGPVPHREIVLTGGSMELRPAA